LWRRENREQWTQRPEPRYPRRRLEQSRFAIIAQVSKIVGFQDSGSHTAGSEVPRAIAAVRKASVVFPVAGALMPLYQIDVSRSREFIWALPNHPRSAVFALHTVEIDG